MCTASGVTLAPVHVPHFPLEATVRARRCTPPICYEESSRFRKIPYSAPPTFRRFKKNRATLRLPEVTFRRFKKKSGYLPSTAVSPEMASPDFTLNLRSSRPFWTPGGGCELYSAKPTKNRAARYFFCIFLLFRGIFTPKFRSDKKPRLLSATGIPVG